MLEQTLARQLLSFLPQIVINNNFSPFSEPVPLAQLIQVLMPVQIAFGLFPLHH